MGFAVSGSRKVLVVCVDRDDDIGVKAGIRTPVVGREACLTAASKLALVDPEEADAIAIFAAVKESDELSKKGFESEVAILSGHGDRGFEADRKILSEASALMSSLKVEGVVLVVDGAEDEAILPVLQGVMPIQSVKRVVIKHSRSVEESYAVLGRYLKSVVYEPKYSRFALGLPGILLLTIGLLFYLELVRIAVTVSLIIIGGALAFRGFDLDRYLSSVRTLKPSGYIRLFSMLASLMVATVAVYQGYIAVSASTYFPIMSQKPELFIEYLPRIISSFIIESINILWIGLGTYFAGSMLSHWMRRSRTVVRDAISILVLALLYLPVLQFSLILRGEGSPAVLISVLLLGLALVFLGVVVAIRFVRIRRQRD